MSVRIVLVDDHNLVRAGIRVLLEDWGYSVVAEGCDGDGRGQDRRAEAAGVG